MSAHTLLLAIAIANAAHGAPPRLGARLSVDDRVMRPALGRAPTRGPTIMTLRPVRGQALLPARAAPDLADRPVGDADPLPFLPRDADLVARTDARLARRIDETLTLPPAIDTPMLRSAISGVHALFGNGNTAVALKTRMTLTRGAMPHVELGTLYAPLPGIAYYDQAEQAIADRRFTAGPASW